MIKIGDIIGSSKTKFKVLDLKDEYYLAEQSIDDKICAYEVGKLIKNSGYNKELLSIPSPAKFGRGKFDKTFPTRKKEEAINYFNNIQI